MTNQNVEESMGALLKDFDVKRIKAGDILDGEVIDVNDKEVTVNINYAFDGVIEKAELTNTDKDPREVVNKGINLKYMFYHLMMEKDMFSYQEIRL